MEIFFEQLIPLPLRETISKKKSQIWLQTLTCSPREVIHITAPSGSGKTTFIHFLYGLRNDFEGKIKLSGKEIKTATAEELAIIRQKEMSIVFQDMRLFATLTARENILLKQQLTLYYPEEKMEDFAGRLNINHKLNQSCSTLSYGEQQRVAIIRALMQPFSWLLLDEPFSHLDENNIQCAIALIKEEYQKRNAGIIMVDLEDDNHFAYTKKWWM